MAREHVVMLCAGGIRSLVALTLTMREQEETRATLLFVDDGRADVERRRGYALRQAELFEFAKVDEIALPHLYGHGFGRRPDGTPLGLLVAPQLLGAAVAHARHIQASRVLWPASFNGDARAIANATEQMMLVEHLAELEAKDVPAINAPVLELTDAQLVELGAQLPVDWARSWSCGVGGPEPCRVCPGCTRRMRAFELAGMLDPAMGPQRARAAG